jgi:hypothetical protein
MLLHWVGCVGGEFRGGKWAAQLSGFGGGIGLGELEMGFLGSSIDRVKST